ncbi:ribosomal protein S12 methylthiotransferase RimO [Dissulfuribacter thermophilus]|uniref:Ribosomal protein uS12 methylthiotransferase RimO n=1 Tax=Dissulfuribacter thermophilus TaxID=1156395 RepID=A0A1B9F8R5_9BACT|nr:30S ribosomal protein S12 methylthiotransferase RimO [Dissulfuribacter thermophilus]OCC16300.1 ribosomal protein S12 methylthiotransferase RimO [Dissulfuribacter thermophilus]
MKIFVVSLGCPKNRIDTEEALSAILEIFPRGSITQDHHDADLIIVNTCAFIQEAVEESIETILELAHTKRKGQVLVVMGCLFKRYRDELIKELPEVDIFFGHRLDRQVIAKIIASLPKEEPVAYPEIGLNGPARLITTPPWRAYLKVLEGCSNRCTFCLIPQIRGPKRSRPLTDIVQELELLEEQGIKEVTFVGQDLTSWDWDSKDLCDLVREVSDRTNINWLRFLYFHPQGVDLKLLETMADKENVCKYLDIPIQHASDKILKRMGRSYDSSKLKMLFTMLRERFPAFALRTTVMVGFPGETEEDFENLLNFIEEVQFDHLGCFAYSDEDEIKSSKLPNKIPKEIAIERKERVLEVQKEISKNRLKKFLGKRIPVLIEGHSKETDLLLSARTEYQAPEIDGIVYINEGIGESGAFYEVEITETFDYDLVGRIIRPLTGQALQSVQSSCHM